jgi:adenylate cyclase class 2
VLETNWILDFADGSLQKKGCGLRVRDALEHGTGNQEATLTFKGPRKPGPLKSREEIETSLGDAESMLATLDAVGLRPILRYEKRRESWRLAECRVELDEPPEIGLFIEIEGPDETSIRTVQARIGLAKAEVESRSYVAMLMEFCEKGGLRNRTLELPPTG